MSQGIQVRKCDRLDDFQQCVALQRVIWGEADLEVEPATMFVVAAQTGGQVLGAFDGEKLIGYTLAVVGLRDLTPYLHSHMTGVLHEYRDRGVGRVLKLFQREEALARGIRRIEWTFDPLEVRNAYFNLNRLGAISRKYIQNMYGVTSSPLHRRLATDRLVAEWHLDSARVVAAVQNIAVHEMSAPATIQLPPQLGEWLQAGSSQVETVQSGLREAFTKWFAKGYAALSTLTDARGTRFLLGPWSEF